MKNKAGKDALARVRRAHKEIQETTAAVSAEITKTKQRIVELAKSGAVPEDEAIAAFRDALDSYARRGRKDIERMALEYTRPSHVVDDLHIGRPWVTATLADVLGIRRNPNGRISDPSAAFVYLMRDQVQQAAEEIIRERCAGTTVPHEDERRAEIREQLEKLKRLEAEHDDLIDEQAELFGGPKSARTQKREQIEEAQRRYEEANRDAVEKDKQRGEPRSPAVTIQDADGNEVKSTSQGWR